MVESVVIAHLVSEEGDRVCRAPDILSTMDFTPEGRGTHFSWDNSGSVTRCGRCAELLCHASGERRSARPEQRKAA